MQLIEVENENSSSESELKLNKSEDVSQNISDQELVVPTNDNLKDEDYILTNTDQATKKGHSKSSSAGDLLSQSSIFKGSVISRKSDYFEKFDVGGEEIEIKINVIDKNEEKIEKPLSKDII
jgi:hypothetical protein